jgi:formylglycine-generating enzyme required for sulfatase activity
LLTPQARGIPEAKIQVADGIWAFPNRESTPHRLQPQTLPNEITNSIGMKLKLVPAGAFEMGSIESKDGRPTHFVTISQPFYLGMHPVTQGEYMEIMKKNPSHFSGGDRLPVESVSWFDAVTFCNALSRKENLPLFDNIHGQTAEVANWEGAAYRLPTEAEWEYACRTGTATRYSFGDREKLVDQYVWYAANSGNRTHPVGEKNPNAFGFYDMHGNVWEWCWDGHDADYYKQSPTSDPRGSGETAYRVIRGGGWRNVSRGVRSAYRRRSAPENRGDSLGFRVARNLSGR